MWKLNKSYYFNIRYFDLFFSLILGCLLSLANPPFSFPYIIIPIFAIIGYNWLNKHFNLLQSFFYGFFFGFGYFICSLVWIVEPFLIEPTDLVATVGTVLSISKFEKGSLALPALS